MIYYLTDLMSLSFLPMYLQGQPEFGEFKPYTMLEDGKTEPQWKTWIWQSGLALRAGNLSLWGT